MRPWDLAFCFLQLNKSSIQSQGEGCTWCQTCNQHARKTLLMYFNGSFKWPIQYNNGCVLQYYMAYEFKAIFNSYGNKNKAWQHTITERYHLLMQSHDLHLVTWPSPCQLYWRCTCSPCVCVSAGKVHPGKSSHRSRVSSVSSQARLSQSSSNSHSLLTNTHQHTLLSHSVVHTHANFMTTVVNMLQSSDRKPHRLTIKNRELYGQLPDQATYSWHNILCISSFIWLAEALHMSSSFAPPPSLSEVLIGSSVSLPLTGWGACFRARQLMADWVLGTWYIFGKEPGTSLKKKTKYKRPCRYF